MKDGWQNGLASLAGGAAIAGVAALVLVWWLLRRK